jgi:hypothetical protein
MPIIGRPRARHFPEGRWDHLFLHRSGEPPNTLTKHPDLTCNAGTNGPIDLRGNDELADEGSTAYCTRVSTAQGVVNGLTEGMSSLEGTLAYNILT